MTAGALAAGSILPGRVVQAAENPPFLKAWSHNYPTVVDTGHGMVVFGPGPESKLHHKWQSFAGAPWSAWTEVPMGERVLGSAPVAVGNGHGGLSVFARGDRGDLVHAWQNHRDGDWFSGTHGGSISHGPSVVVNPHGTMTVFCLSSDGRTVQVRQDREGELPGQGWTAWQDFGTGATGQPMVVVGATGGMVLFVRGTNGRVLHKWQNYLGGQWLPSQTGDWADLGGDLSDDPVAVVNPNGGLSLFGRRRDGRLIHAWQTVAGGTWDLNWIPLGNKAIRGRPAVVISPNGGMNVFAWGQAELELLHWWQAGFSGIWTNDVNIGGVILSQPSAVLNPSGKISVFARTPPGFILHKWQRSVGDGGPWDEVTWPDELN